MKSTNNLLKNISVLTLAAVVTMSLLSPALAIPPNRMKPGSRLEPPNEFTNETTTTPAPVDKLATLKSKALAEINRRIARLNALINQIGNMTRLSAEQKQSFTADIEKNIATLNGLKATVEKETNLTKLISEARAITSDYRIFAVYIPKIRILANAEKQLATAAELEAVAAQLKTGLDIAPENRTNGLLNRYNDLLTQIVNARLTAQEVYDAVLTLTPAGYPGNTTILKDGAGKLRASHQNLVTALRDAKDIRDILRDIDPGWTPAVTAPGTN